MISYGGIDLVYPTPDASDWINAHIPASEAFEFFRPRHTGNALLNPRIHCNWFLSRPIKINAYFNPWGMSRWGYALVLADGDMLAAIQKQNNEGEALPFIISDGLGNSIETDLFQLPAVPLSKLIVDEPQLPLWLVPLVDERYRLWERAGVITVTENTTTWVQLYDAIETALGIDLTVDAVPAAYLMPSAAFGTAYQPLPMLLDWVASSVGQRIIRNLDGTYQAYNPSSANALVLAQANLYRKYAGGSLDLEVVDA